MHRVVVQVEPVRRSFPATLLPKYQTPGAAGLDLHADIAEPISLRPGERALVPTGIRVALPEGFEAQVRPRSGLALRYGLTLLNSPGTIDADYRGEIRVLLANLGNEECTVHPGQRIAQMVVAPVVRVELEVVDRLPPTERGEGGFGHTGEGGEVRPEGPPT